MTKQTRFSAIRTSRGATAIEAAFAAVLLAVLMGLALPSFRASIERHRVEGVTAQFKADVRYAYSEAIARGAPVHLTFAQTPAGSCYVISTPQPCPCDSTGRVICRQSSETLRTALLPKSSGIKLTANISRMTFDGYRNTVTPAAAIDITSKGPASLQAIVNIVGRTRVCDTSATGPDHTRC